ncbi:leucine-rich repeat protein, partial [bacterium]|nr:leucine-rich repeat protein [bacterium]
LQEMNIGLPLLSYSGLALTNVNIRADNPNYESIDGVIYSENLTNLYVCPTNKTKFTIPSHVTRLGSQAFELNQTTSYGPKGSGADIIIPDSVTTIGPACFAQETNVIWIEIPSTVTTFESTHILNNSGVTSHLRSVYLPNSCSNYGTYFWNTSATIYYESNGVTREQFRQIVAGN